MSISRHRAIAILLAVCLGDTPADIHAEPLRGDWRIDVPVSLSANTLIQSDGADTSTFRSMSAGTGLDFWSDRGAWSGGIFVDRHISSDNRVDGMANAGGYLKYRLGRWDTSAVMISSKPPGTSSVLFYGGGLRYRITDGHKLGVQSAAPARDPRSAIVMLRYDGSINRNLSVNIAVGTDFATSSRHMANFELVWDVM